MSGNENDGQKPGLKECQYAFPPIPFFELDASKHFGAQLRELRKKHKIKLRELSARMGRLDPTTLCHWEVPHYQAKHSGNLTGVIKYCKAMNIQELRIKITTELQ